MLTKNDLDQMGCEVPGCDHHDHDGLIFITAQCCYGSGDFNEGPGLDAGYEIGSGVLTLSCRGCGKLVQEIAIKGD